MAKSKPTSTKQKKKSKAKDTSKIVTTRSGSPPAKPVMKTTGKITTTFNLR